MKLIYVEWPGYLESLLNPALIDTVSIRPTALCLVPVLSPAPVQTRTLSVTGKLGSGGQYVGPALHAGHVFWSETTEASS